MSKLYFRYGAMNSGKSTAVLQVAHNYEERGMNILLVKPALDTKGNDRIISRLGADRKVDILATPDVNLEKTITQWHKDVEPVGCVLSDEAQFFTSDQIDQLLMVAALHDIPVICYGIRTDFQTKLFPGSLRLMELAHSLEELKTICRCGKKAIFNGRKINGKFVFTGNQVAIDGERITSTNTLSEFGQHSSSSANFSNVKIYNNISPLDKINSESKLVSPIIEQVPDEMIVEYESLCANCYYKYLHLE